MEKAVRVGQPKAFYPIFFVEFWERFGYYGMQCLLALYFVKALGFSQKESFATFGAFTALCYGFVAIGGYIGDSVLGTKRTIKFGALVLAIGYFLLAFSGRETVFLSLGIICVGNGLFKANPSSLLAKCYDEDDPRLHGAFTMYYMAINAGSFISMSLSPAIADRFGYSSAFVLSAIGLIAALLNFILMHKSLRGFDSPVGKQPMNIAKLVIIIVGTTVLSIVSGYLLEHVIYANDLMWLVTAAVVAIFFVLMFKEHGIARKKMWIAFILMLQAVVFFTLYQQMPTSLNFFSIYNMKHTLLGIKIDPQTFQVLNPFWIVVMSPILAMMYTKFGLAKKDLSLAGKFALGMTLCGISFTLLYFARFAADSHGIVSSNWIIASYFFQSTGELLISALGLAMVSELVPDRMVGFIMGMWFLTSAIAGVTGGMVASLTAPPENVQVGIATLNIYTKVFLEIGIVTLIISAVMWLAVPKINKYIEAK